MPHSISFGNNDNSVHFSNVRSNSFEAVDDEHKKKNVQGPMSDSFDYRTAFRFADPSRTKEAGFQA